MHGWGTGINNGWMDEWDCTAGHTNSMIISTVRARCMAMHGAGEIAMDHATATAVPTPCDLMMH